MTEPLKRCPWIKPQHPLYIAYHDEEWGVPVYDDRLLFEMLCLEGAQAGLSWWTVLQKRENYRKAFDQFDAETIVLYTEDKLAQLKEDAGIIRHTLKIKSVVKNAQSYLNMQQQYGSFSDYIWYFVKGERIVNHWTRVEDIPTSTALSDQMSKQLKKDGFTFVGTTICYSYMQAVGLVNDHLTTCFCYQD